MEVLVNPVVRLHLVGVVLLLISFSLMSYGSTGNFKMLLMSSDQNEVKECNLQGLIGVIKENINPYEGMDVLSFMSSMEKAIESKADAIVLPHSIVMERENSILQDYLRKLNKENQILFVAPEVNSKNNIFSSWNSVSMEKVKKGEVKIKDLRIQRKLGKLSTLLNRIEAKESNFKRLKIYL